MSKRYSFSRLTSFRHCPMSYYLENVATPPVEELENSYAQYGTFIHKLIEGWGKNEIPDFALAEEYMEGYDDAVTMPFPPFPKGLGAKYYEAGLSYFQNFHGFGDEYEILSVEEKFVINVCGYEVSGIADLILRNKETSEIVVIDHKSKSMATMKKDLPVYRNQLYIYAMAVYEKYGVYPSKLIFNLFREEGQFVEEEFSIEGLEETKKWIVETIHDIEESEIFNDWPGPTDFYSDKKSKRNSCTYFCSQICGVNSSCKVYEEMQKKLAAEYYAEQERENQ